MPTYSRYRRRQRVSADVFELNAWQEFDLCCGPCEVLSGWPKGDMEIRKQAWAIHGERITREYAQRYPGERPGAWWTWSRPDEDLAEGETAVEYLHRLGLLGEPELAGIRRKALGLAAHNRGRSPRKTAAGFYLDNWVPPDDVCCFAAKFGLLTAEERAILHL